MKMYELVWFDDYDSEERIGLFFSHDKAKARMSTALDDDELGELEIREIETDDEPDFATLAGEAFYATAE